MIESKLTQTLVTNGEPQLADYLRTGTSDYSTVYNEAFEELLQDLKARNLDVRRLCKRLSLKSSTTETAVSTGDKSDRDWAQRQRVVIIVTALTGEGAWTLQGTDDSSSETWTDISVTLASSGADTAETITGTFTESFKYYRIKQTASITTITWSAYLVETVYERLHILLSRAKIYESLQYLKDDLWLEKALMYRDLYNQKIDKWRFYFDEDDDDSLEEAESKDDLRSVVVTR